MNSTSDAVSSTGVAESNVSSEFLLQNGFYGDSVMQVPENATALMEVSVEGSRCLCIFDMDRTLTGAQEDLQSCPRNRIMRGHYDNAYRGGTLTLSELGQNIGSTFCGGCHLGGITAHPSFRYTIEKLVHHRVVRGCDDGCKVREAKNMARKVGVHHSQVFFFDDKADNVWHFHGSGMNARQVSCGSRSGSHGLCGARAWEVRKGYGVNTCR